MTFGSADAVYYTLLFVVPGFIASSVLAVFTTRRPESGGSAILRYLTYSAFNYAIWSWAIYLLIEARYFQESPAQAAALWFMITFVSPAVMGVLLGCMAQRDWGRQLLQRVGLRPVHVIPTAWDFQFGQTHKGCWALVTLKDGGTVAGFFGGNSFASSSPAERDLYLEQLMRIEDGQWRHEAQGKGALIAGSEIRMIEFIPVEEGS